MTPNIKPEEINAALKAALKEAIRDGLIDAELANPEDRKALFKEAHKEAAREFLQENAATFGWWSVKTFGALVLLVLVYLAANAYGWVK